MIRGKKGATGPYLRPFGDDLRQHLVFGAEME
jgi:hypothetical protein